MMLGLHLFPSAGHYFLKWRIRFALSLAAATGRERGEVPSRTRPLGLYRVRCLETEDNR